MGDTQTQRGVSNEGVLSTGKVNIHLLYTEIYYPMRIRTRAGVFSCGSVCPLFLLFVKHLEGTVVYFL